MGNHLNVMDILHLREVYILLIIVIVVCVTVVLGLRLVTGILYGIGRDIERVLVLLMLYSFAIIIVTMGWPEYWERDW